MTPLRTSWPAGGLDEARDLHFFDLNGRWRHFGDTNNVRHLATDGSFFYTVGQQHGSTVNTLERWRSDGVRMNGVTFSGALLTGVAVTNGKVFVIDSTSQTVRVFNSSTLAEDTAAAFPVADAARMALDSAGCLWITTIPQDGAAKVRRFSSAGLALSQEITLFSGSKPAGVTIHPISGSIYVADRGPRQQIHVYAPDGTYQSSLGAEGGIFSSAFGTIPGRTHPLKFNSPVDIEFDLQGNSYVACGGQPDPWGGAFGSGTELRKFDATMNLLWERLGITYVDSADPVPGTNGTEVYTKQERISLDYSNATGQEWRYEAYTLDPFSYPDDPRLTETQPGGASVRTIGGKKILFVSEMSANWIAMYRFQPGSEIAIPCGLIKRETARGQPGNSFYVWVDTDGDGARDASEIDTSLTARSEVWGFTIDENGGLWAADKGGDKIRYYPCKGLNAIGAPVYGGAGPGASELEWPAPGAFVGGTSVYALRAFYSAADDTLFIGGYRAGREEQKWQWKAVGSCLGAYTGWLQGTPAQRWLIDLPYQPATALNPDAHSTSIMASAAVAGDYVFAVFMPTLDVYVYNRHTGQHVQILEAGPEVCGNGALVDIVNGISACRRANGEYVVWVEDDATAKINMYRWAPPENPEISISLNGSSLSSGAGIIAFGAPVGEATTRTFVIHNTGDHSLFGVSLVISGSGAGTFSLTQPPQDVVPPGAATSFMLSFSPTSAGTVLAEAAVVSNDPDESPFAVDFEGRGYGHAEAWRAVHFGTPDNSGSAADDADADGDGLVNLMERALGISPTAATPSGQIMRRSGNQLLFDYQRSKSASESGLYYLVEWSDSLSGAVWSGESVTQTILSQEGDLQQVQASIPIGTAVRRFVRLRVTSIPISPAP